MTGRDFLHVARMVLTAPGPASYRTAVGRAYYAAFNVASEHLRNLAIPLPRSSNSHSEVYRALLNSGDKGVAFVGSELGNLRSERNRADYDLSDRRIELRENAEEAIERAEACIKTLDAVFSSAAAVTIKAAIEAARK